MLHELLLRIESRGYQFHETENWGNIEKEGKMLVKKKPQKTKRTWARFLYAKHAITMLSVPPVVILPLDPLGA